MNLLPVIPPRKTPQFPLFLAAVIQAVGDYQGLLRLLSRRPETTTAWGANEAPRRDLDVSGDELTAVLDAIETDSAYAGVEKKKMKLGVDVLPRFLRDNHGPQPHLALCLFTGKTNFEFRMLGSL